MEGESEISPEKQNVKNMFRKMIQRLSGAKENPCEGWPDRTVETPSLVTTESRVGHLKFGEPLSGALPFGKPDVVEWIDSGTCKLIYAQAGFELEFDQGKMSSAAFFIGKDRYEPKCENLGYAKPMIDSVAFDNAFTSRGIEAVLGAPQSIDEDPEETVYFYHLQRLTIELELGAKGALKRINCYPTA